jgi:CheY-like chemotaxis protein
MAPDLHFGRPKYPVYIRHQFPSKTARTEGGMDVLLAEDDALVREALAETLADAGLIVAAAVSAEDALRTADEAAPVAAPSVLVTDVDLGPGMDGHALAGACRRRWPALAVVVISGEPDNLRGRDPGPRGVFLTKPLRPAQLVRQVLGWVAVAPPPAAGPPPASVDDVPDASGETIARRPASACVGPTAAPSPPARG